VPYDPKNEELEDITISGCTIRVSKGEVRRARHFEILEKSNEEWIKLISELQQLIMRKGCYMLDTDDPQRVEKMKRFYYGDAECQCLAKKRML
jgi:hypothetical protein